MYIFDFMTSRLKQAAIPCFILFIFKIHLEKSLELTK